MGVDGPEPLGRRGTLFSNAYALLHALHVGVPVPLVGEPDRRPLLVIPGLLEVVQERQVARDGHLRLLQLLRRHIHYVLLTVIIAPDVGRGPADEAVHARGVEHGLRAVPVLLPVHQVLLVELSGDPDEVLLHDLSALPRSDLLLHELRVRHGPVEQTPAVAVQLPPHLVGVEVALAHPLPFLRLPRPVGLVLLPLLLPDLGDPLLGLALPDLGLQDRTRLRLLLVLDLEKFRLVHFPRLPSALDFLHHVGALVLGHDLLLNFQNCNLLPSLPSALDLLHHGRRLGLFLFDFLLLELEEAEVTESGAMLALNDRRSLRLLLFLSLDGGKPGLLFLPPLPCGLFPRQPGGFLCRCLFGENPQPLSLLRGQPVQFGLSQPLGFLPLPPELFLLTHLLLHQAPPLLLFLSPPLLLLLCELPQAFLLHQPQPLGLLLGPATSGLGLLQESPPLLLQLFRRQSLEGRERPTKDIVTPYRRLVEQQTHIDVVVEVGLRLRSNVGGLASSRREGTPQRLHAGEPEVNVRGLHPAGAHAAPSSSRAPTQAAGTEAAPASRLALSARAAL
mmetsp:Transcript_16484/g.30817  ORF Transcript_16484/g.30817 Transcript_16484/m.30817 type:complete len:561 (-) Transcript_16484:1829-3511(-)